MRYHGASEALAGIRHVRESFGLRAFGAPFRGPAARSRVPEAVRSESEPARVEAKGYQGFDRGRVAVAYAGRVGPS